MWLFPLNVCKEEIKHVYYISTRQYIHFSLLVSFLLLQRFMAFKHQQKVCSNWIKSTKKMQNSISFYCKILLWRSSSVQTIVGMKYSINIHFFQCSINNCQIWDEGSPKRKKKLPHKNDYYFSHNNIEMVIFLVNGCFWIKSLAKLIYSNAKNMKYIKHGAMISAKPDNMLKIVSKVAFIPEIK